MVATQSTVARTRRQDIDRRRILAVLLLFRFHSARVFDAGEDFYVRNAQESDGLGWTVVAFLDPWQMGPLFAVAGMAPWWARAAPGPLPPPRPAVATT